MGNKKKNFECILQAAVSNELVDDAIKVEMGKTGMSKSKVVRTILVSWAVGRGYLPLTTIDVDALR